MPIAESETTAAARTSQPITGRGRSTTTEARRRRIAYAAGGFLSDSERKPSFATKKERSDDAPFDEASSTFDEASRSSPLRISSVTFVTAVGNEKRVLAPPNFKGRL